MEKFDIKSIEKFMENEVNKTRLTIDEKEQQNKEIILEGQGSIKIAIEA